MLPRVTLMAFTLLPLTAQAQEPDLLCNGKYAFAQEMLDAAYSRAGTLYSGGSNFGGVGASLDIWRLLVGKPDYNFRTGGDMFKVLWHRIDPPGSPWDGAISPEWAQFGFDRALPYATAPNDKAEFPGPRVWVSVMLDFLTPVGPSADWWINPEQREDLTATEAVIADVAAENDLIDWLMGALVQSVIPGTITKEMSWSRRWGAPPLSDYLFRDPALLRLEAHYWQRFEQSGGTEWAILAYLFSTSPEAVERADALKSGWEEAVTDCSASPAEYVAFAVSYYDSEQQNIFRTAFPEMDDPYALLPLKMQAQLLQGEAFQLLARQTAAYRRDDYYSDRWVRLAVSMDEPEVEIQRAKVAISSLPMPDNNNYERGLLGHVPMLMTDDVTELGAVLQEYGLAGTTELLALLSADDLFTLAKDRPAAKSRWSVDKHKAALVWAAFLRFLALGRDAEAYEALKLFVETDHDYEELFAKYDRMDAPLDVRMALFALDVPQLTLRVAAPRRSARTREIKSPWVWERNGYFSPDLPDWVRSGAPVQRMVDNLLHVGQFWYGVKGYTRDGWLRQWDRPDLGSPPEPQFIAFPPRGPYTPGVPFGKLVALDELSRLGPETGLTQRLSEIIIRWADEGSDTWAELAVAQTGPMPEALARIVRLNRSRTSGNVDGVFAGKRAFQLLHERFPFGEAARQTRYWHKCESAFCDR